MSKNYRKMNGAQLCVAAGLTADQITKKTYLYIDTKGRLTHTEKIYHDAQPGDEAESLGYAHVLWGGDLAGLREEVARI